MSTINSVSPVTAAVALMKATKAKSPLVSELKSASNITARPGQSHSVQAPKLPAR